ncbi:MAG: CBS domain-containing protein [Myxococcota bacterium]
MNLAFFLTPLDDVSWLPVTASVADAMVQLRRHSYTAVPLLDAQRRYVGTLTEGDLLFWLADHEGGAEGARLAAVPRRFDVRAVAVDTDVRGLLGVAADQNFVPVVDSRGVLMGIVTRRAILVHLESLLPRRAGRAWASEGGLMVWALLGCGGGAVLDQAPVEAGEIVAVFPPDGALRVWGDVPVQVVLGEAADPEHAEGDAASG